MLDHGKLRKSAIKLEDILKFYAKKDPSASECLGLLLPYIEKAKKRQVTEPITRMPCGYTMHEGELRKYLDLEEAYSDFSFLARGIDEDAMIQRVKEFDPNIKI